MKLLWMKEEPVLEQKKPTDKTIWFSCPSLGEYEQGLPLLKDKRAIPLKSWLLFSPSGYEVRKNNTAVMLQCIYLCLKKCTTISPTR
jgi:3-deoxy-D-manno-octulosonic-acid transferase